MPSELLERALELSVEERLQLVEEIWDSIAAAQEVVPLAQAQIEDLELQFNPDAGSEELRARLSASEAGIRRAQALVRSYIPEGLRLSDDLVEERRKKAPVE